jgi:hypothetical protein
MTTHPSALVMTRIGGQDYPMRSVPTCKTCQSPYRADIESALVKGSSYASIARDIEARPNPGRLGHPSVNSITDHVKKGHLPIGPAAQRALIERRSKEIGLDIENEVVNLADHVTVARMVVQKGFEAIQAGDLTPDVKDVMAASKFLFEIDRQTQAGLDQETFMAVLHAYMEVATKFIPPEMFQAYGRALDAHPTLRMVTAKMEQQARESAGMIEG